MPDKYAKKLENIIKQMLQPIKGIPLNLVIENFSGKKIVPVDLTDSQDINLIDQLSKIANEVGNEVNKKGILRERPNEVGNDIESFVKKILNKNGFKADCPVSKNGRKQSMGYPDIEFKDKYKRTNYLECKTYNIENINTTQRSFYLSPTENTKITRDAHHFLLSFEIYVAKRIRQNSLFKCESWKLLDIEKLDIDVKYEFQSDNERLYKKEMILAQGKVI